MLPVTLPLIGSALTGLGAVVLFYATLRINNGRTKRPLTTTGESPISRK